MMAMNTIASPAIAPLPGLVLLQRPEHVITQTASGHHAGDGYQCSKPAWWFG